MSGETLIWSSIAVNWLLSGIFFNSLRLYRDSVIDPAGSCGIMWDFFYWDLEQSGKTRIWVWFEVWLQQIVIYLGSFFGCLRHFGILLWILQDYLTFFHELCNILSLKNWLKWLTFDLKFIWDHFWLLKILWDSFMDSAGSCGILWDLFSVPMEEIWHLLQHF